MWIVQPLQIAKDGKPTGKFRLTATSDEDGGGPIGLCGHEHDSAEEAGVCGEARRRKPGVTGIPRIERTDKDSPTNGARVFTCDDLRAAWIAGRKQLVRFEMGDADAQDFSAWMQEPPGKPDRLQPHIPVRVRVESYAEPYVVDHGRGWGEQRPLACLWVELSDPANHELPHRKPPIGWSGAYVRLDKGVDEVAAGLEVLAKQLRSGEFGATGNDVRMGNEVNREAVADLLLPHE